MTFNPFTEHFSDSVGSRKETDLINDIKGWLGDVSPPFPAGIGDDCAVVKQMDARAFDLFTVDGVAWSIHFDDKCDPVRVGRKLVKRNLSDIAAMGGVAHQGLLSAWTGPDLQMDWLKSFYQGIREASEKYGVAVLGGDVSHSDKGIFKADMFLRGTGDQPVLRKSCSEGDLLWVTGDLGGSILGKHLDFEPRLAEGKWLSDSVQASGMIDLSDGLSKDLFELVGNRDVYLDETGIPISNDAQILAFNSGKSPLEHAFNDGEDYELLFTTKTGIDPKNFENDWKSSFETQVSCIGKVGARSKNPSAFDSKGEKLSFLGGYEHF